jgi:hypothetical protein
MAFTEYTSRLLQLCRPTEDTAAWNVRDYSVAKQKFNNSENKTFEKLSGYDDAGYCISDRGKQTGTKTHLRQNLNDR